MSHDIKPVLHPLHIHVKSRLHCEEYKWGNDIIPEDVVFIINQIVLALDPSCDRFQNGGKPHSV